MVLGPRARGWVPVRTAEACTRVEGSLVIGEGAGLEDEGWRAVGVGRVDMLDWSLPRPMAWNSEGGRALDGREMNFLCFPHSYPFEMTSAEAMTDGEYQKRSHSKAQYEAMKMYRVCTANCKHV